MNASLTPQPASAYGRLEDPATLRIQRTLPGPIERVWSYLVDSDLRRQWLAAGDMAPQPGTDFELVWRNDELSASPAERPEGFNEVSKARCTLTELKPPHTLRFLWPQVGEVSFELAPVGDHQVMLTVTHRQLPDRGTTVMVGAGWHMHLDILQARVAGEAAPSFWAGWVRLREEYARRVGG